jgi:hypothetical protein
LELQSDGLSRLWEKLIILLLKLDLVPYWDGSKQPWLGLRAVWAVSVPVAGAFVFGVWLTLLVVGRVLLGLAGLLALLVTTSPLVVVLLARLAQLT